MVPYWGLGGADVRCLPHRRALCLCQLLGRSSSFDVALEADTHGICGSELDRPLYRAIPGVSPRILSSRSTSDDPDTRSAELLRRSLRVSWSRELPLAWRDGVAFVVRKCGEVENAFRPDAAISPKNAVA